MENPTAGHRRDRRFVQQALLGLGLKLIAIVSSLFTMPLMLNRLGKEELGIWLVILSIYQWITFLDLGIAAGARNQIARAIASRDRGSVRIAVTTGLYYTLISTVVLSATCAIALFFLPITEYLETFSFNGIKIGNSVWIVAMGSCAALAFGYVQIIYAADQRSSASSLFSALSNLIFMIFLLRWPQITLDKLDSISLFYLLAILMANLFLIANLRIRQPDLFPHCTAVDRSLRTNILGFGIRIFVIQIAAMIVFTTSRLMASTLVDPASVVTYDAGFKLFSVITMVHSLVMSTIWSSFTNAHALDDWHWISTRLRWLMIANIPIIIMSIILAIVCPFIIERWMTQDQVGDWQLYFSFALLTAITTWSNIFAYFLNGIGDTAVQLRTSLVALIVHLPACYLFASLLHLGLVGINIATTISIGIFTVVGPVYVRRLTKLNVTRLGAGNSSTQAID